jgi:hypothetical protein
LAEKVGLEGVGVIKILHPKLTVCPSGKAIVGDVVTDIPSLFVEVKYPELPQLLLA